ncbi:MAG: porin family protein [Lactobacillaceae bacterium]|nr:porin family protein [Lactobacillaceae bacterium]
MKKTLLLAGAALSIAITGSTEASMYVEMSPYIGLDYSYSNLNMKHGMHKLIENDYNVFSANAGFKVGGYVGLEGFIERASIAKYRQANSKFSSNHWAAGADLLGYLPISEDFELIGGIGFGEYKFFAKEVGRKTYKDAAHGVRFTGGIQFNLDENWGVRAAYRYVDFSSSDRNRSNEYTLGFRYNF